MKPISSPLSIVDVAVLNFEYDFVFPDKEIDIKQNFDSYDLDIDFTIRNSNFLQVFIKSAINRGEKKLPGYSISAEIVCVFKLDKEKDLSAEVKNSMEGFSTVYIALNNLRGIISQFTGGAPMGRYILPSIDLNNLIEQKKRKLGEEPNKKNSKKGEKMKRQKKDT